MIDLLKQAEGTIFVNEDGLKTPFQLLPPLDHKEVDELQAQIPCPVPDDMLELLHPDFAEVHIASFRDILFELIQNC